MPDMPLSKYNIFPKKYLLIFQLTVNCVSLFTVHVVFNGCDSPQNFLPTKLPLQDFILHPTYSVHPKKSSEKGRSVGIVLILQLPSFS